MGRERCVASAGPPFLRLRCAATYHGGVADAGDLGGLVIVGAGGFAREVLDVVEAVNAVEPGHRVIGFLDDGTPDEDLLAARGVRLLGAVADLPVGPGAYVVGIGDPQVRRLLSERVEALGRHGVVLAHPTATTGAEVAVGAGSVICAHVSITTNISIGRHTHVNLNSTIGHDCILGDYVTVYPGVNISGDVRLDTEVSVGTGTAIIQGVHVGAGTVIGAGSVVTRDLPAGVVAMGAPARPVRDVS